MNRSRNNRGGPDIETRTVTIRGVLIPSTASQAQITTDINTLLDLREFVELARSVKEDGDSDEDVQKKMHANLLSGCTSTCCRLGTKVMLTIEVR